jgi:two-component system response regulator HydG
MCDARPPATSRRPDPPTLCTQSPAMRAMWDLATRVAPIDASVLITGEYGVGKGSLARWLHDASSRATHRFEPVTCDAVPETRLQTELFGYARWAVVGARAGRRGRVEAAHGGTLFLDEIGGFSQALQVRLMRVLQDRELRRLGETQARPVDVRFIAATTRDLSEEIRSHRFREDLYYQLIVTLHVPPLRERLDDLPALADRLLARAAARSRRPIVGCTPAVLSHFLTYDWPGNMRELARALDRACAVAAGPQIDVDDLPGPIRRVRPHADRA